MSKENLLFSEFLEVPLHRDDREYPCLFCCGSESNAPVDCSLQPEVKACVVVELPTQRSGKTIASAWLSFVKSHLGQGNCRSSRISALLALEVLCQPGSGRLNRAP